jgi:hypothetical protein
MGTLGDNLLKLTEFPFSYSFFGLLILISGGGGLFEDASLEKLGPALILMGFFATTLTITDPIGALQKVLVKGRGSESTESWQLRRHKMLVDLVSGPDSAEYESRVIDKIVTDIEFLNLRIFGKHGRAFFKYDAILASLSPSFLMEFIYYATGRIKRKPITYSDEYDERRLWPRNYAIDPEDTRKHEFPGYLSFISNDYLSGLHRWEISLLALSLRDSTLRTTGSDEKLTR